MVNELVKVQSTRDDSEHIAYIPVVFLYAQNTCIQSYIYDSPQKSNFKVGKII